MKRPLCWLFGLLLALLAYAYVCHYFACMPGAVR